MADKKKYNLRNQPKMTDKGMEWKQKTDDTHLTTREQQVGDCMTGVEHGMDEMRDRMESESTLTGTSIDQNIEGEMAESVWTEGKDQDEMSDDTELSQLNNSLVETTNGKNGNKNGNDNQIQQLLLQLMQNMNDMNQNMNEMKTEVNQNINEIKNEMNQNKDEIKNEMNQNMNEMKYEMKSMNSRMEEKIESMEDRMCKQFYEMKLDHNQLEDKVNLFEEKLEQVQEKSEKVCEQLKEDVTNELKNTVGYIDVNLERLQQKVLQETKEKLDDFQEKIKATKESHENITSKIQIVCGGNHHGNFEQTYHVGEKFNGRQNNPHEYLNRIQKTFEKHWTKQKSKEIEETDFLYELIDGSIEGNALRWWQLVRNEIETWEDFAAKFINKFWNREIQKGVKHKMEIERYHQRGKLNRTDYFIERVLTMKGMIPEPEENEIVDILCEHFEQQIQDAKRVQNIKSISEFEGLLQRIDVEERNNQIKQRNNTEFEKKGMQKEENWRNEKRNPNYQNKYGKETTPKIRYDHPYKNRDQEWKRRGNYYGNNNNFQRNNYNNDRWRRRDEGQWNQSGERPVRNQYFERKRYEESGGNRWNEQKPYEQRKTGPPNDTRYQTREQRQVCNIISNQGRPNSQEEAGREQSHTNQHSEQQPTNQENY